MNPSEPVSFNQSPLAGRLAELAAELAETPVLEHFRQTPDRVRLFSREAAGWHLDFSRHLLNQEALDTLLALAEKADIAGARQALFSGQPINHTEGRAVLHTLLRCSRPEPSLKQEQEAVRDCLGSMETWVDKVHGGEHCGYSGETITDVVNLGIGGSDLGPRMVVEALAPWADTSTRVHFVANIDPVELAQTLAPLDPARTLFIVCSKSLKTEETLHNAQVARRWLVDSGAPDSAVSLHYLAVSTHLAAARDFGIPAENILPMWDWVGGRYSLWSAVGWSIAFAVGMGTFRELLAGAEAMDWHFREAPAADNLPVILSLLEIWCVNFLGAQTQGVIPYSHRLRLLPAFLQQLTMESNGKSTGRDGNPARCATAPILWGGEGTNGQHSFHQLLHQGTRLCPVDFILPLREQGGLNPEGHRRLVANCLAQGQALLAGRNLEQSRQSLLDRGMDAAQADALAPHLVIPGNRPSSTLSCERLTPATLGALLALYEHKTFCSGHLWGINAFDQWGVELGKELSSRILAEMAGKMAQDGKSPGDAGLDPSTAALLGKWHDEGA